MDEQIRKQMTFYRSFAEAIDQLPKGKQLAMYRAVVSYGLTGQHCEKLDGIQATMFKLIMPNLDASRTKASAGKHGGSAPKAKGKQNESKTDEEFNREKTIKIAVSEEKYMTLEMYAQRLKMQVGPYVRRAAINPTIKVLDYSIIADHTRKISEIRNSINRLLLTIEASNNYMPQEIEVIVN